MPFELALAGAIFCAVVLLLAGFMNSRRGISRVSLIPWDYVMIIAAIVLVVLLAQLATIWRDSQPH